MLSYAPIMPSLSKSGKGVIMGLGNWWERHGVPRMIKLACGAPQIMKLRSLVVPLAKGRVFELG